MLFGIANDKLREWLGNSLLGLLLVMLTWSFAALFLDRIEPLTLAEQKMSSEGRPLLRRMEATKALFSILDTIVTNVSERTTQWQRLRVFPDPNGTMSRATARLADSASRHSLLAIAYDSATIASSAVLATGKSDADVLATASNYLASEAALWRQRSAYAKGLLSRNARQSRDELLERAENAHIIALVGLQRTLTLYKTHANDVQSVALDYVSEVDDLIGRAKRELWLARVAWLISTTALLMVWRRAYRKSPISSKPDAA